MKASPLFKAKEILNCEKLGIGKMGTGPGAK